MSGNATIIGATFLARKGSQITPYEAVPISSHLHFTTDMRTFSGSFEFELEFGASEKFPVQAHDFVELYFQLGSERFQIGVGYLDQLVKEYSEHSLSVKASGRDLIAQVINLPFRQGKTFAVTPIANFAHTALIGSYVKTYATYRGIASAVRALNPFPGGMLFVTDQFQTHGGLLQHYADLANNLLFQSRSGQLFIFGRNETGNGEFIESQPIGTLIRVKDKSNVQRILYRQDYSKVVSECTIFWQSSQANASADDTNLNSARFINSDDRVKGRISQPTFKVFSATDLKDLAGNVAPDARIAMVGKSVVRKSNQNLLQVVVITDQPFYTEDSGNQIAFEVGQTWQIQDGDEGIDKPMVLVGISYQQAENSLSVQLAFIEEDTLV